MASAKVGNLALTSLSVQHQSVTRGSPQTPGPPLLTAIHALPLASHPSIPGPGFQPPVPPPLGVPPPPSLEPPPPVKQSEVEVSSATPESSEPESSEPESSEPESSEPESSAVSPAPSVSSEPSVSSSP